MRERGEVGVASDGAALDLANQVQLLLSGHRMQDGMDALMRVLTVCAVAGSKNRRQACGVVDAVASDAKTNARQRFDSIKQSIAKQAHEGRA